MDVLSERGQILSCDTKTFDRGRDCDEARIPKVMQRGRHFGDRLFYWLLKAMSWAVILLLCGIVFLLLKMAWPTLTTLGFKFFITNDWNPPMEQYGALAFIYGTVMSSLLALLLAAPVSLGVALFLTEIAPKGIAKVVGFLVEMLAAIPSVVYGLWGIFVLSPFMQSTVQPKLSLWLGPDSWFSIGLGFLLTIPAYAAVLLGHLFGWTQLGLSDVSNLMHNYAGSLFAGPGFGVGMLTASIILAVMVTPTIASMCREIFNTVDPSIREASLALGATRWEMMRMAVLATAKSGILGAVILGLGRALGETMAVTMVIGNRSDISASILAPAQTMASVIANEYPEASGLQLSSLAAVGLALFVVSLVINSVARLIIWNVEKKAR